MPFSELIPDVHSAFSALLLSSATVIRQQHVMDVAGVCNAQVEVHDLLEIHTRLCVVGVKGNVGNQTWMFLVVVV